MTYPLILSRALNTPLLISEEKLDILTNEVFLKLLASQDISRNDSTSRKEAIEKQISKKRIGIVPISGSLVHKNGAGASGVSSYENIKNTILSMVDSGVTDIIFEGASSGGEAHGNFPLADFIYNLPQQYGVNTYGYTESYAHSGAYSLLAATQKIFTTDMASLGSIGAVATLVDMSKLDEESGLKYKIIRSRAGKQLYNPHEGISEEVIKSVTAQIKDWDAKFFTAIETYRPQLTNKVLTELDGRIFNATKGLELGLVDEIVTSIEDVFSYISSNNVTSTNEGKRMTKKSYEDLASELSDTQATLIKVQADLKNAETTNPEAIKAAVAEERDRCLQILASQETYGISATTAKNAITKGYSLEMATAMFEEIKANLDETTNIDTSTSQGSNSQHMQTQLHTQQESGSFNDQIEAGLQELGTIPQLFKGVR